MKLSLRSIMKPKMDAGGCVGPACMGCQSGNCMSKGGKVKGVHEDLGNYGGEPGSSPAGYSVRASKKNPDRNPFTSADPKREHERVLGEMKAMPKPNLYAEGGEVEGEGDMDGDDSSMLDACGQELLDAFERKDKGQILEAIRAIVLSLR